MRFVILDGFLPNFDGIGMDLGPHEQVWYPETAPEEVIPRLQGADGVLTNRMAITAQVMEACPDLKYIGTFGTGYNNIDVAAAKARGIAVCNVPGYSTAAVAQHAFALLLEVVGRAGQFSQFVHSGAWSREGHTNIAQMPTYELVGKTLGIFGAGAIGHQMARLGAAFGMEVLACRRTPKTGDGLTYVDFDTLLDRCDVISIHAPLTEQTQGLFGAETLEKMKDGAILINTARGAILDEQAVVEALDRGKLLGVGVDVLTREPPAPEDLLYRHPKAVVTPHIAWIPRETRARLLKLVGDNILTFAAGRPQNVVNGS